MGATTKAQRIAANLDRVFRDGDSGEISAETYKFLTLRMGFIAHYNREGFAATYRDLRVFARALQASEYGNDPDYNLRWADECDRRAAGMGVRESEREWYTGSGDAIRAAVRVARAWSDEIDQRFGKAEAEAEIATAARLAGKYGLILVPGVPTAPDALRDCRVVLNGGEWEGGLNEFLADNADGIDAAEAAEIRKAVLAGWTYEGGGGAGGGFSLRIDIMAEPWHCPYCGGPVADVRDIDDTRATLHCAACGSISEITRLEAV